MSRILAILSALLYSASLIYAQERPQRVGQSSSQETHREQTEETVRIRTRAVFVDVLVKDQRTGVPIRGLKREEFRVVADGKPRAITYFSREEEERRPRIIIIALDIKDGITREILKKREFRDSLISAVKNLPFKDKIALVGIMASGEPNEPCKPSRLEYPANPFSPFLILQDFTHDREKLVDAINTKLPEKIAEFEQFLPSMIADHPDFRLPSWRGLVVEGVVCAMEKAGEAAANYVNSPVVLIAITGNISFIPFNQRGKSVEQLLRAGVTVNIIMPKRVIWTYLTEAVVSPSALLYGTGLRIHEQIAKQSGGEVVEVGEAYEYGQALERLINDLAARYNLGFTLGEQERDDGQFHKLEIRVIPNDAQLRRRKLVVHARRGYYVPKEESIGSKMNEGKP